MCKLHGDLFICMSACLLTLPSIVCLPISYYDVTITVVHKRPHIFGCDNLAITYFSLMITYDTGYI